MSIIIQYNTITFKKHSRITWLGDKFSRFSRVFDENKIIKERRQPENSPTRFNEKRNKQTNKRKLRKTGKIVGSELRAIDREMNISNK